MKIIIDADGCPVRKIVVRVAKEYQIPLLMVKNIYHDISDEYGDIITVDANQDMADHVIVKHTRKGDLVVTQDYGLASLVLGKGAYAIHQNGWFFTHENIDALLMKRHIHQEMRRKQKKYSKTPKRKPKDNEVFEEKLRKFIAEKI
ncbi:YaiI/YqxD family protein [Proteinivorax hydrogeniformans]|uniref:UPF0178 protein PRVXH_002207 n=1 Tax=Proteinivorax hydrogeniformans TaxID=1826727 RepID=A0AAU8HRS4_9FIRM